MVMHFTIIAASTTPPRILPLIQDIVGSLDDPANHTHVLSFESDSATFRWFSWLGKSANMLVTKASSYFSRIFVECNQVGMRMWAAIRVSRRSTTVDMFDLLCIPLFFPEITAFLLVCLTGLLFPEIWAGSVEWIYTGLVDKNAPNLVTLVHGRWFLMEYGYTTHSCRRKFRSETSDNMDSWKAEVRRSEEKE